METSVSLCRDHLKRLQPFWNPWLKSVQLRGQNRAKKRPGFELLRPYVEITSKLRQHEVSMSNKKTSVFRAISFLVLKCGMYGIPYRAGTQTDPELLCPYAEIT